MSDCLGKLIVGVTGLLLGSAELADGTRKRKTLSVALGLLTALASIALLCVCAYNWLTGEENEIDDADEEADEAEADENGEVPAAAEAVKTAAEAVKTAAEAVKAAADTKADEAAPAQEEAE